MNCKNCKNIVSSILKVTASEDIDIEADLSQTDHPQKSISELIYEQEKSSQDQNQEENSENQEDTTSQN